MTAGEATTTAGDGEAPTAAAPAAAGAAVADEAEPNRIIQLEETVINRIAAGEVVVRPANALKELMENSIDAGSTKIMVSVKAGGMKMLRIEDDGCGIHTKDLPILCERFTTSKLKKYEDLNSIGTFGFRGEALASVSHVAHVTVSTMRQEDKCAHMAQYLDGNLRGPPRPCAGTRGTTLVVEDMFYNNPTRRQALAKESIEHTKVLEVIQKYAVHYPSVSFSCRKAGSASAELLTPGGAEAKTKDAVGIIYGHNLSRELFSFEFKSEDPKFACTGLATGPNWTAKTCCLTLFINHRLVECPMLRKAIEAVYATVLPRHQHPWVYLALELDPTTVDVNVHPTKSEVQFLNEELIAQRLQEALNAQLRERGGSRTFDTKLTLFGGDGGLASEAKATAPEEQPRSGAGEPKAEAAKGAGRAQGAEPKRVELNPTRVRTDHLQRSLDSVWRGSQSRPAPQPVEEAEAGEQPPEAEDSARLAAFADAQRLTSICELKAGVAVANDPELTKKLNQSVYVGPATHELVLLQCGATLCLVNLACMARECAYQRMLRKFGGPGNIALKDPLPLQDLLKLGILDPRSGYNPAEHAGLEVEEVAAQFAGLLAGKAEMLNEYMMMEIVQGKLVSVPNALGLDSDSGLNLEGLPLFLVRLCVETDWSEEKVCFGSMCRIVAEFCTEAVMPSEEDVEQGASEVQDARAAAAAAFNASVEAGEFEDVAAAAAGRKKRMRTAGPHALQELRWVHEAIRRDGECQWPATFARDGTVLDLVSLDQLYRIFERC